MERGDPRSQLSHPGEAPDMRSPANLVGAKRSIPAEPSPDYNSLGPCAHEWWTGLLVGQLPEILTSLIVAQSPSLVLQPFHPLRELSNSFHKPSSA